MPSPTLRGQSSLRNAEEKRLPPLCLHRECRGFEPLIAHSLFLFLRAPGKLSQTSAALLPLSDLLGFRLKTLSRLSSHKAFRLSVVDDVFFLGRPAHASAQPRRDPSEMAGSQRSVMAEHV